MTLETRTVARYIGTHLYSAADSAKIGRIGQIYLDDATGRPEWVTISTGFLGTRETFVPIADAVPHEDGLAVPFSKDQVKHAPRVELDAGGHLSEVEEQALYRFYGAEHGITGEPGPVAGDGTAGDDPIADDVVAGEVAADEPTGDRDR